ncbi:DUF2567 domain-containing protein [Actinokineospora globicatena]|uniref:DUF2567 domain-containing protein n=1 Tax=Actinokineospora globicatena TaxID=103729 RepID=A0A9W6V9B9_9PSEU|nr:DUF2567 domain-containing protein [Actinokineospora globicatena]MCP2304369.1 Protein of unknown function (DUF2567) [Actinokineospora globicatena]GLW78266.1 hypothetical protein Aglo01_27480 [Actinokineospora globicatena]GLW85068.1 hypothetical protein Aglo02_27080 [Actinokineospora globicatena]GLW90876.1 hypothetical protein Aglo03_16920 [Actinokineospora globicatena]
MADQPVRTQDARDPLPTALPRYPTPWGDRVPAQIHVRRDLLPAISVLSTVSLLGLAVGFLWSRLAPGLLVQIVEDGTPAALRTESYHRFDDLVLFMLLGLAAGVITGAAVWLMRERRGPVLLVAAVLGSALAAWLAYQVGLSWAQGRFPLPSAPAVGDVLTLAPRLESAWAVLAWPLGAALSYGIAAAWNGHDDLGRRLG